MSETATSVMPRPLRLKVYDMWSGGFGKFAKCRASAYITSPNQPNESYPTKDGIVFSVTQWVDGEGGLERFKLQMQALVNAYNTQDIT